MLDINFIRENTEKVKKGVAAKQLDPKIIDEVLVLYDRWTEKLQTYEKLRQERNRIAHESKGYSEEGKNIKEKLVKAESELLKAFENYRKVARDIPNPPADDVKVGKDESENEIIGKWGKIRNFDFTPLDHLEIGENLGIIDIKRASKVSGARFTYLKGDVVLLEFALISLALETLIKEGFTPIIPPVLMKVPVFHNLGYSEHLGNENYYLVKGKEGVEEEEPEYYLVGTAEHSIVPYFMDEVLNGKELPKRFVGFSSAFRREAGSYGKDTKGMLRVHQFDKVEMVSFVKPEEGDKEHEFFLSMEKKLLQALKIPYQVVKMCSGDLGAPAARKYDLEAWMPGQGKYREVTSTSTTTDFQARRLNIRFKERQPGSMTLLGVGGGERTEYVHALNGTAFAIGRTIITILENYQQKDGSVAVPEVLRKWVGKEKITPTPRK